VKKDCTMVAPDLVAHVAVREVEAGEHHRLQLRLLGDAGVHAVSHLYTQFILDFCHPKITFHIENNTKISAFQKFSCDALTVVFLEWAA
jgi:hypothetical protein